MRIATWNTEWRKANTQDAKVIRERLESFGPDIVCLTETHYDFLDGWHGHSLTASDDWGGPVCGTRRQVLIWSKWPWRNVDTVGAPALPKGRYARATTETPWGAVTVVGVVIPYHMSNVSTGTRDRKKWELHHAYLDALATITPDLNETTILMGDFNQRVPSKWVPKDLREKLVLAMGGLKIVTAGTLPPLDRQVIDHIATGSRLIPNEVGAISNIEGGKQISDHLGVKAVLRVMPKDQ